LFSVHERCSIRKQETRGSVLTRQKVKKEKRRDGLSGREKTTDTRKDEGELYLKDKKYDNFVVGRKKKVAC